jgi:propanol-preferring alcohol dehydrogenase
MHVATMRAYQLTGWQQGAKFAEVTVPVPRDDQVLVRVAGVGLCHTDVHFLEVEPGLYDYPMPFTLGHEIAGWVETAGRAATDLEPGEAVVVSAHFWCGRCRYCLRGLDNYCTAYSTGLGYGADGGLAEFVVVDRHSLVRLGDVDPRTAGPLADAGSTAYHAAKRVLPRLVPGSHALVIGAGGLGGYLVQYLAQLSAARVVVVDTSEHRLEAARRNGAHQTLLSGPDITERLTALLPDGQAEGIFDLVGVDATMATALACSAPMGAVAIIGAGYGTAKISWPTVARECEVFIPQGGTIPDLEEVVALVASGVVHSEQETFSFDDVPLAYERVRAGDIQGRAVVVMD